MIAFWIFMMIMDLLIPCVMIGFGKLFLNSAPKDINYTFGYRTKMSMKNTSTWKFAHNYCGKIWFRLGLILLPISVIPMLVVFGRDIKIVGTIGGIIAFVQLVPMLGSIIPVEIALRKKFDQYGRLKDR